MEYNKLVSTERSKSNENLKGDANEDDTMSKEKFCLGLSKRQCVVFIVLLMVGFFAGVVYSIKGPFYPREAELKGASATQYGLVFGVFELTKCVASPIYGHFMKKLGSRNVFYFGILTVALCSIFFGLLHEVNGVTNFVVLSFLIRVLEALGNSAFSTAAFTTVICEFPNSIATAFASFETFFGIGLIIGPLMGGVFHEMGGYMAPFIVTGVLLFITFVVTTLIMPPPINNEKDIGQKTNKYSDIFVILSMPGVLLSAVAVLSSGCSVGFIGATLEPHIRQFDLTPVQTGLIFIIFGVFYAMFAPIWGRICDKLQKPAFIMFLGSVYIAIAFLLIGPAPFLNFDTKLWVTSVGLMLQGLGVSAVFVSGFITALQYSIKYGYPDDVSTYSVISGLWASVSALGMFIGPSAAGLLMDSVGFRWGSLMLLISSTLMATMIISFIIVEYICSFDDKCIATENSEQETLLKIIDKYDDGQSSSKAQIYGSVE